MKVTLSRTLAEPLTLPWPKLAAIDGLPLAALIEQSIRAAVKNAENNDFAPDPTALLGPRLSPDDLLLILTTIAEMSGAKDISGVWGHISDNTRMIVGITYTVFFSVPFRGKLVRNIATANSMFNPAKNREKYNRVRGTSYKRKQ